MLVELYYGYHQKKLDKQGPYRLKGSLVPFTSARALYIRYRQKEPQKSELRSFVIEAELNRELFEVPPETREHLKALGYTQ